MPFGGRTERNTGEHVRRPRSSRDAEVKIELAIRLNELIEERGLSLSRASRITGLTQSRLSNLRHLRLRDVSLERLMAALVALDQRVEISVRPARPSAAPAVVVKDATRSHRVNVYPVAST